MASPAFPLYTLVVKSNTQVRDDILRTEKNGLIGLGISNPNVGPGSDYYITATATANEIAVILANSVVVADQLCPDTASGVNLDRWLNLVGLSRAPATNSFGNITITTSVSSTLVVLGTQLKDNAGQLFQVIVGGSYANGAQIPVESIAVGSATDHANGDVLTWVTTPPFTQSNVTVGLPGGSDGLTGGNDSEVGVDEPPRARLFARLQNPPKGGNSSHIAGWAAASTPNVGSCYVYPAGLGPATVLFAVAAAPQVIGTLSSTSKNRDIASALLTGTILPYVQGNVPEHTLVVGTSIANQPVDVAILLSLPSSATASPPGPGGGWIDGTPWPSSISGTTPVTVTSFTNSTQFTVNATSAPNAGVSHIAWISPLTWTVIQATVLSVTGTSGAYVITIDTPMPGITTGNYIFPASQNQANYLAALFAAFATMGAGEWIASGSALFRRAFRHPPATITNPAALGASQLKTVINSGPEVLDANWIYRSVTTPTVPASVTIDPVTQLLTSAPPNLLVPRNIAFFAA